MALRTSLVVVLFFLLGACYTVPLKQIKEKAAQSIELSLIGGNVNVDKYKTISRIKVYALDEKTKRKKTLTEKKLELSTFKLNRETISVGEDGQAQFKYWVTELEGDIDLTNMGLPPEGRTLLEVVDKKANVLAVKGFPEQTIFYLPKIALPQGKVKPGATWTYQGKWRSLKTGWPFRVNLNLKLDSWLSCGGLRCAYITYSGEIGLPEDNPLKGSVLESKINGEFIYTPIGHQFIWSYAKSVEMFRSDKKIVEVKSCTASYQISPDKEARIFSARMKRSCN